MLTYTLRRLLLAILTLFGITVVTFSIVSIAPGDPAAIRSEMQDPKMSARVYEDLRKHFELDRPIPERYVRWLGRLARGDFGTSFSDGQPVGQKILARVPATASLSVGSILLGLACAIPFGLFAGARRNSVFDRTSAVALYALYAVPSYVMAVLLIYFIGVMLEWLPLGGMTSDNFEELSPAGKGWDLLKHFTLITACYTYHSFVYDARFIRQNLLEVVRQDFVRTARAKGVAEPRVILRHAFPNTLIPVVTHIGLLFPAVLSGSVILEVIFNWPGIGRLFFEGVLSRDYPLVMGLSTVTAVLVLIGNLVADLAYAYVDPRISYA